MRASSLAGPAVLAFGSCVDRYVDPGVDSRFDPGAVNPIVVFIIAAPSGLFAVSLKLSACCICRFLSYAGFPALVSCTGFLRWFPALAPLSMSLTVSRSPSSDSRLPIPDLRFPSPNSRVLIADF
jgi:cytochrome bd-type quinol oxidase subunit 2